jgi:hypothetical protein
MTMKSTIIYYMGLEKTRIEQAEIELDRIEEQLKIGKSETIKRVREKQKRQKISEIYEAKTRLSDLEKIEKIYI